MPLGDLKEELYKKDSELDKRKHEESQFDPSVSEHASVEEFQEKKSWGIFKKGLTIKQIKALKITTIAILAMFFLAIIFVTVSKFKQTAFSDERVIVEIEGPKEARSNQLAEYKIKYKNNNRVALENAEITLDYTENFQPENGQNLEPAGQGKSKVYIGKIKARQQGEIVTKGKFYAPEDYMIYFNAALNYIPSNFNSTFQSKNQLGVEIKSSPIFLSVNAPLEASDGNDIEYVINYQNLSDRQFKNLELVIEYPKGFNFKNADPYPFKDDRYWQLGDLMAGQEGEIKIQGKIQGFKDEGKTIKASVCMTGSGDRPVIYSEKERVTKIIASPLIISQSVNGSAGAINASQGENLRYILSYRNNGETGLRDVIITLEVKDEGSILDFSKLILRKGAYDGSRKTITWKAGHDIPELARLEAGEGGAIEFSVPVKERIEIDNENDKNFSIESIAKIDSPDIPFQLESNKIIASDELTIKLNSKVILEAQGYYNDANIENFGPIPPEVNKETNYVMHWLVTNVSNDISDVEVSAALPTWAKWTGKVYPENEKIDFNSRTNQIVWDIGNLKNGTGILDHPKEISFQIGVVPGINQLDKKIEILGSSTLTAKDTFTSEEIKEEIKAKDSALMEDMSIDSGMYKVVNADAEK